LAQGSWGAAANGNAALACCHTIATGAALAALILTFRPISGAHLNPMVSIGEAILGRHTWGEAWVYVIAQISGGIFGTACADVMFALPPLHGVAPRANRGAAMVQRVCGHVRADSGDRVVRAVRAKMDSGCRGLLHRRGILVYGVTSFANPAVTIARSLSDTLRASAL